MASRRRRTRLHPQIQASEQGAGVTCRRSPYLQPQIQANEDGAGVTCSLSPRLHPKIEASDDAAGVPRRRSTRIHPQIVASEDGAGVARRRSPRLHPQIEASEDGAGVTRRIRRRRRRKSQAEPDASLPDDDDMLREILIRLPPLPSSLPRASAVCKRWRGLVTDPKFHRQFYAHHQKPPLLGVFRYSNQGIVFTPVLDHPDHVPPERFDLGLDSHLHDVLDCRHGRVLLKDLVRSEVVVCDPITGQQRRAALPSELSYRVHLEGAVLCAARDHGHVHGGCHLSSYKVVLVSTGTIDHTQCLACVYSLETGRWGDLITIEAPFEDAYDAHIRATLLGNCLYWTRSDRILEFDLDKQNLAAIMGPPCLTNIRYGNRQIFQAVDGAVGYTILLYPCLEMWQRNISAHGIATWVPWKTIEMHTILRLPSPDEGIWVQLLLYDEDDDDVAFLGFEESVYIVQLKSMQSRKLDEIHSTGNRCFPFRSFFTPGTAIAGGFNGAEMLHTG